MKRNCLSAALLLTLSLMGIVPTALAHEYMVGDNWGDYQALANEAQSILDTMMAEYAGCNLWSTNCGGQTAIWTTVYGQRGPAWVPIDSVNQTADHGANRTPGWGPEPTFVRSDYHWSFLEEALKSSSCLEGVPPARVQEIRNAFNANKNRVLSTEITVYGVRVRATVLGCDNDHTRDITTGGTLNLPIKAGTPYPICSTVYTVNEGIPSLFGTAHGGPLLNEAHPKLRDLLANMTAAYMTIGDSRVVDYWYAFMGRLALTFVQELLPGLIANIGKSNSDELDELGQAIFVAMLESLGEISFQPDKNEKAGCLPWGNVAGVDISKNVSGIPVIGSVTVRVTIPDTSVCLSIRSFADKFTCSSYTCLPEYLAVKNTQGDLNADGRRNLGSWFLANQNLQEWKVNEGAGGYLDISAQPAPPGSAVNYGASYNLSVTGVSSVPITYQWYAGYSPGALSAVPNATTRDYNPTIDVYSFNGTNMHKYFRVDLNAFYCGTNHTLSSSTIQILGGNPPSIDIWEHPVSGNYYPGQTAVLKVNASSLAGTGLSYQWQKYNVGTSTWDNLSGETSAILTLPLILPADAGQYRVQIFNQVPPSPVYWQYSSTATLNIAPAILINPQPLGAELTVGSDHTLTLGASVDSGNLEYCWQRNTGLGYQNLGAWVNTGGTSFSTSYDIIGAQIADAGTYRCLVRNTLLPFGTYETSSEPAVIAISSGTVYRVDKTAPGTTKDGLSWATAFTTIQPAIDAAYAQPGGGEVWVAGGPIGSPLVYNEVREEWWGGTTGQPGRIQGSLVIKTNVRLYGGFEGYRNNTGAKEQYRDQRVVYQNPTVIDGSISRGGSAAYHVVVFGGIFPTTNAALDGFIVTGGNAAGISGDYHTWRGGGIYNWQSAPIISNCQIIGNRAAAAGGGMANEGGPQGTADAVIFNCILQGNQVAGSADDFSAGVIPPWRGAAPNPLRGGGGIFINRSNPTLRFLTIRDNTQTNHTPLDGLNWGINTGGLFAWSSGPGESGGAYNSGNILMTHSILWGNTGGMQYGRNEHSTDDFTVTYSNIQGGWTGSGSNNLSSNPLLDANSVPQTGSPVINSGDPLVPVGEYTDIRGVPRPIGARVDRGAVEVSINGPTPVCRQNVFLDFIKTPEITDIFYVYDDNASTSEVPIWKITLEDKTFDCSNLPTPTNPFATLDVTVTDILGRSAVCTAELDVTESAPPTAVNNPKTINLLPQGQYTLEEDDVWAIGAASYDNCSVGSISVVPSLYRCSQAGKNIWATLLVVDREGNASSRNTLLMIRDVTPPTAVGGAIDVSLSQFGSYTLTLENILDLGTLSEDACGVAWGLSTASPNTFNCSHIGSNNVVVTIYDNHGNSSTDMGIVTVHDVTPPILFGVRSQSFTTYSDDYTLEEALATVTADDFCEGDLTHAIGVEAFDMDNNPVAFPIPHSFDIGGLFQYPFTLRYTVQDGSGNEAEVETILNLYDLILPEITVLGEPLIVIECGDEYIDPGATAIDPSTGFDISDMMQTVISVDKNSPGDYAVTYFILLEEFALYVQEQRTVEVVDNLEPAITLFGDAVIGHQVGTPFEDPGYTAQDHCEGDLTSLVVVGGAVDSNVAGEYLLSYDVSDGTYDAETQFRRVLVGNLFAFTQHPQGNRLYTTDPPHTLEAGYINGFFPDEGEDEYGHEWHRDSVGLGIEPPELSGNTVSLIVDPAIHEHGVFAYKLVVTDEIGEHHSNEASVEIAAPMAVAEDLTDISLVEGANHEWSISISGGLGNLTYQWYRYVEEEKGFIPVINGYYPHPTLGPGRFVGANTHALVFDPYTEAMAGQYQVEVSDDFETITVGPAVLLHAQGIPAAGVLALAALSLAAACSGALALRKKS